MCSPQRCSQQHTEFFLGNAEKAVCVCVLTDCMLLIYFITFKARWCCRPQPRACCFCFSSLGSEFTLRQIKNRRNRTAIQRWVCGRFWKQSRCLKWGRATHRIGLGKWVSAVNTLISLFVKMFGLDFSLFFWGLVYLRLISQVIAVFCRSPWQPDAAITPSSLKLASMLSTVAAVTRLGNGALVSPHTVT